MVATNGRDDSCTVQCDMCGVSYLLLFNREDMIDWLSGSLFIQDAFPYLSASERELLLSGLCDKCFTQIFSSLDTDDDDMYN